jgi:hypothetical protein
MNAPSYKTCPKCGHHRQQQDIGPLNRCPACGLYFDKWLKRRFANPLNAIQRRRRSTHPASTRQPDQPGAIARLKPLLLPPIQPASRPVWFARATLWLTLLIWGGWFMLADHRELIDQLPPINYSILHGVDLIFHEAGHVIFAALGNFMAVLGGSLMQLLVPAVACGSLLFRQRDPFGASVALWWLAQSIQDLAPYIYDARRQQMLLLGGGTGADRPGSHDWNNLLGRMGILHWDHALAWLVNASGTLLMLAALLWGALLLRRQWQAR